MIARSTTDRDDVCDVNLADEDWDADDGSRYVSVLTMPVGTKMNMNVTPVINVVILVMVRGDSLVEVVVVVSPASQPHPKSERVSRRQGPGARQQAEQHRNGLRKQGTRLESASMFVH